jgi:hypothetical protein
VNKTNFFKNKNKEKKSHLPAYMHATSLKQKKNAKNIFQDFSRFFR